jgi:hypothetical protein
VRQKRESSRPGSYIDPVFFPFPIFVDFVVVCFFFCLAHRRRLDTLAPDWMKMRSIKILQSNSLTWKYCRSASLESMPRARYYQLKRMQLMLANQSEDCLFLNIYAPSEGLPFFPFLF